MSDLTRDKLIEAMAEVLRTYGAGKCVVQPNKAYLREANVALDAIGALAAVVPREASEEMLMTKDRAKEIEDAALYVYEKFARDLAHGYSTKDKVFAFDILGQALGRPYGSNRTPPS